MTNLHQIIQSGMEDSVKDAKFGFDMNLDMNEKQIFGAVSILKRHIFSQQARLLEEILEGLPKRYDGWSNFGKEHLNDYENGFNQCLSNIKSDLEKVIKELKEK